jgi:GTP pyrophosphokinase
MLEDELRHNGLTLDDVMDEAILTPILKRLSFTCADDLYAAIGYGGLTATRAANRLRDELKNQEPKRKTALDKVAEAAERRENQAAKKEGKAVHGILVEGLSNCLVKFSRCCTPVPGDDIMGFITRGQGVSIHRRDCANCQQLLSQPENEGRWVHVSWASKITDSYLTTIVVSAKDRSGLVMDVATVLNTLNAKVHSLSARTTGINIGIVTVTLEVKDADELRRIVTRLSRVNGVSSVTRNGN